jgi:hypothetical protein
MLERRLCCECRACLRPERGRGTFEVRGRRGRDRARLARLGLACEGARRGACNPRRARRPAAARLIANGEERPLLLEEVEALLASKTFVVDACRHVVGDEGKVVSLTRRPVLFALARALGEAWPASQDASDAGRRESDTARFYFGAAPGARGGRSGAPNIRRDRLDPRTGEVLERLEMPPGVGISGLESDGGDQFFCGGGKSGKVRAVRRPKHPHSTGK